MNVQKSAQCIGAAFAWQGRTHQIQSIMREIVLDLAVSLDGFIEGPHGEIDWITPPDINSSLLPFLDTIDTILYGRVSYDLWGNYQPGANDGEFMHRLYEAIHSKKKYVFSNTRSVTIDNTSFVGAVNSENVHAIKDLPGKDIWLYGGGSLISSFVNQGLIDRYRLGIYPVILGAGKPLFQQIQSRVSLELLNHSAQPDGMVLLEYAVKKAIPIGGSTALI